VSDELLEEVVYLGLREEGSLEHREEGSLELREEGSLELREQGSLELREVGLLELLELWDLQEVAGKQERIELRTWMGQKTV